MSIQKITLKKINKSEALRYLGYGEDVPDDSTNRLLGKCERELLECLDCKYIYRVFFFFCGQIPGSFYRLEGDSIAAHLMGCTQVILLAATLSGNADRLIRRKQISGMAEAIITDALASAAIEQVCDIAEAEIMKNFPDMQHTRRFGLGYGDFPLEGQAAFLDILDAPKRIGVCVSPALMLTPMKSVTCVIGLGRQVMSGSRKTCEVCSLGDSCPYRAGGASCRK